MPTKKNEHLTNLLIGILVLSRSISDSLHDGFQAKDLMDLMKKYHDEESDFGAIIDRAIESGPKLADELKDFELKDLLTLSMQLYPDIEELVGSLVKIDLSGRPNDAGRSVAQLEASKSSQDTSSESIEA